MIYIIFSTLLKEHSYLASFNENPMVKTHPDTYRWLKVALINLLVTAAAGIILRYKMNFPLAVVNQKYLLHGHSHFAFVGWVTLALMALLVHYLSRSGLATNYARYRFLLIANTVTAYGMLFTFAAQGYALFSITFSTLSIFVSYAFIFYFWRDLRKVKDLSNSHLWFRAALILWALSSAGAFSLAFLMAMHIKIQEYYFSAIYFFLHFQYNGWFLFACFGLLFSHFTFDHPGLLKLSRKLFLILALTVVPAYFLSLLWLKLPAFLYWAGTLSGIIQLIAVVYLFPLFKLVKKNIVHSRSGLTRLLWCLACCCFAIKVILQAGSALPSLANLAFGFRPVVIAYLHLCFLGIISFFIIGYFDLLLPEAHKISRPGAFLFISGVVIQEIILMLQGFEMMGLQIIPRLNILLFAAAVIIGTGLATIAVSLKSLKGSS